MKIVETSLSIDSLHDSSCLFGQSNWYDTEYSDCDIQFWKQSVKFSSFSLLSS